MRCSLLPLLLPLAGAQGPPAEPYQFPQDSDDVPAAQSRAAIARAAGDFGRAAAPSAASFLATYNLFDSAGNTTALGLGLPPLSSPTGELAYYLPGGDPFLQTTLLTLDGTGSGTTGTGTETPGIFDAGEYNNLGGMGPHNGAYTPPAGAGLPPIESHPNFILMKKVTVWKNPATGLDVDIGMRIDNTSIYKPANPSQNNFQGWNLQINMSPLLSPTCNSEILGQSPNYEQHCPIGRHDDPTDNDIMEFEIEYDTYLPICTPGERCQAGAANPVAACSQGIAAQLVAGFQCSVFDALHDFLKIVEVASAVENTNVLALFYSFFDDATGSPIELDEFMVSFYDFDQDWADGDKAYVRESMYVTDFHTMLLDKQTTLLIKTNTQIRTLLLDACTRLPPGSNTCNLLEQLGDAALKNELPSWVPQCANTFCTEAAIPGLNCDTDNQPGTNPPVPCGGPHSLRKGYEAGGLIPVNTYVDWDWSEDRRITVHRPRGWAPRSVDGRGWFPEQEAAATAAGQTLDCNKACVTCTKTTCPVSGTCVQRTQDLQQQLQRTETCTPGEANACEVCTPRPCGTPGGSTREMKACQTYAANPNKFKVSNTASAQLAIKKGLLMRSSKQGHGPETPIKTEARMCGVGCPTNCNILKLKSKFAQCDPFNPDTCSSPQWWTGCGYGQFTHPSPVPSWFPPGYTHPAMNGGTETVACTLDCPRTSEKTDSGNPEERQQEQDEQQRSRSATFVFRHRQNFSIAYRTEIGADVVRLMELYKTSTPQVTGVNAVTNDLVVEDTTSCPANRAAWWNHGTDTPTCQAKWIDDYQGRLRIASITPNDPKGRNFLISGRDMLIERSPPPQPPPSPPPPSPPCTGIPTAVGSPPVNCHDCCIYADCLSITVFTAPADRVPATCANAPAHCLSEVAAGGAGGNNGACAPSAAQLTPACCDYPPPTPPPPSPPPPSPPPPIPQPPPSPPPPSPPPPSPSPPPPVGGTGMCYYIKWNNKGVDYEEIRPIFPLDVMPPGHQTLTNGLPQPDISACAELPSVTTGGKAHWYWWDFNTLSTSDWLNVADAAVIGMPAVSAFYAYGYPFSWSANTGKELSDTINMFFLMDSTDCFFHFYIIDKPWDGSGGNYKMTLSGSGFPITGIANHPVGAGLAPTGTHAGVPLSFHDNYTTAPSGAGVVYGGKGTITQGELPIMLRDDPWNKYEYETATGRYKFTWKWLDCCTDGMILGPMPHRGIVPAAGYKVTYEADCANMKGLNSGTRISMWNPYGAAYTATGTAGACGTAPTAAVAANAANWIHYDVPMEQNCHHTHGIQLSALPCEDACPLIKNCGECTAQLDCGWDGAACGAIARSARHTIAGMHEYGEGTCTECSAVTDPFTCMCKDGCGWAPLESKCISGTADYPSDQSVTVVQWSTKGCPHKCTAAGLVPGSAGAAPADCCPRDGARSQCYRAAYNQKAGFQSYRLADEYAVLPATSFPAAHPKVTTFGGSATAALKHADLWQPMGPTVFDAGAVFMAQNRPATFSTNTGSEASDALVTFLVQDDMCQTYLLVLADKAADGTGGTLKLDVTLDGTLPAGTPRATINDAGQDTVTYDPATKNGTANFAWQTTDNDGLAIGPMPYANDWSINLKASMGETTGLETVKIGTYDAQRNDLGFVTSSIWKASHSHGGVQFDGMECTSWCQRYTDCYTCSKDEQCQYSAEHGGCIAADAYVYDFGCKRPTKKPSTTIVHRDADAFARESAIDGFAAAFTYRIAVPWDIEWACPCVYRYRYFITIYDENMVPVQQLDGIQPRTDHQYTFVDIGGAPFTAATIGKTYQIHTHLCVAQGTLGRDDCSPAQVELYTHAARPATAG